MGCAGDTSGGSDEASAEGPLQGEDAGPSTGRSAEADAAQSLADVSPTQWRSGIAAWLGWMFDGLDMHLYTLVATPFVAQLLIAQSNDPMVTHYSGIIQAAFLVGWALGGGFFGRIGDRLGRSRALMLTILTYAIFTGLSYFAQTWWQLMIFRFLAALGIGGEWAVGASLLSETWPKKWRPWIAATLQSAVNIGVLLASVAVWLLAGFPERTVFLVGVLPAFLVFWIRKNVPEPDEWHSARLEARGKEPGILDLFAPEVRPITLRTTAVCALSLTAHWAFMFWYTQHLRTLPTVAAWSPSDQQRLVSVALIYVMIMSIVGNFVAAMIAKRTGYRRAITTLCLGYFGSMLLTYGWERDYQTLVALLGLMGVCSGVFGLFTMYLPPLFPTLLRTTGAGFCYNIGRLAAAAGTILFGLEAARGSGKIDFALALWTSAFLFVPAALLALTLPEPPDEVPPETARISEPVD